MKGIPIAAACLVLANTGLGAQAVEDRLSCSTCMISWRTAAVLAESHGTAELSTIFRVNVDSRRRYWVFSQSASLFVFDQSGKSIRAPARRGQGPGEVQSPSGLIQLPDDSVAILDANLLLHVFDPELRYVRTIRLPILGIYECVVLHWPTMVVANALDPTPARFGILFHVLDSASSTGRVLSSFGAGNEAITQSTMYSMLPHALARSRSGGYWAASLGLYSVSKWSDSNRLEFTLDRRPSWFRGRSDMLDGGPEKPPSPRCVGVTEDDAGFLWSFCLVPAPGYREAWRSVAGQLRPGQRTEIPSGAIDRQLLHHTRIEVIDPVNRVVVARSTLEQAVTSVLPGPEAAVYVVGEGGEPEVRILRFALRVRERE